jgi:hypothetical protein
MSGGTHQRRGDTMNTMSEQQQLARRATGAGDPGQRCDTVTLADGERQRCEVWTRVMGYHRPVASFNIGKKGEHAERRFFTEAQAGTGGSTVA